VTGSDTSPVTLIVINFERIVSPRRQTGELRSG
jgi:hypothetical protein